MKRSGVGQLSVFAKYEKTRHELANNPQRPSSTFNIDSGDEIEIVELLLFRMQLELQHNRATLLRGSGLENDKMENQDGLGQITLANQTD